MVFDDTKKPRPAVRPDGARLYGYGLSGRATSVSASTHAWGETDCFRCQPPMAHHIVCGRGGPVRQTRGRLRGWRSSHLQRTPQSRGAGGRAPRIRPASGVACGRAGVQFHLARAAFLVVMARCTAHGQSPPRRAGFAPHFPLCAITLNPHRGPISLLCAESSKALLVRRMT